MALMVMAGAVGSALAQDKVYRPEDTFFFKPKLGVTSYLGDHEKSPLNFDGDGLGGLGTPIGLAGEFGYQLSVPFSVSLALVYGNYPVITQFPPYQLSDGSDALRPDSDVEEDPTSRISVQAFGRYTFAKPTTQTAFYLNFGLTATFGDVKSNLPPTYALEEKGFGFGPVVGFGLDRALNARSSFFVEIQNGIHAPDDGLDDNADNGGFLIGGLDHLMVLGVGLKVNFTAAITPVGLHNLTCPADMVLLGEDAPFSVDTNPAATEPVSVTWSFGDGRTADGHMVDHAFADDGEMTVTVEATNPGGTVSEDCMVNIVEPPTVVTVIPNKNTVSVCDDDPSVTFGANVRGTTPMTYAWDFGDGATSSESEPSHTYAEPGSYEVTLTLTNEGGTATETMQMEVTDEGCFDCNISTMNTVFFDRNSSTLNEEARPFLAENLEILQNCEFSVQVVGYAAAERNPQQLSEDRAAAVAQYYLDNGIDEGRLEVMGLGAPVPGTKKAGADQYRRVDTIPPISEMEEAEEGMEMEEGEDM